jgi:hypothetical protein
MRLEAARTVTGCSAWPGCTAVNKHPEPARIPSCRPESKTATIAFPPAPAGIIEDSARPSATVTRQRAVARRPSPIQAVAIAWHCPSARTGARQHAAVKQVERRHPIQHGGHEQKRACTSKADRGQCGSRTISGQSPSNAKQHRSQAGPSTLVFAGLTKAGVHAGKCRLLANAKPSAATAMAAAITKARLGSHSPATSRKSRTLAGFIMPEIVSPSPNSMPDARAATMRVIMSASQKAAHHENRHGG